MVTHHAGDRIKEQEREAGGNCQHVKDGGSDRFHELRKIIDCRDVPQRWSDGVEMAKKGGYMYVRGVSDKPICSSILNLWIQVKPCAGCLMCSAMVGFGCCYYFPLLFVIGRLVLLQALFEKEPFSTIVGKMAGN